MHDVERNRAKPGAPPCAARPPSEAILLLDLDGRVVQCNGAAAEWLGRPSDGIVGQKCFEVLGCLRRRNGHCPVRRMLSGGGATGATVPIQAHACDVQIEPLFGPEGKVTAIAHVMRQWDAPVRAGDALRDGGAPSDADAAGRMQTLGMLTGIAIHDFNNLLVALAANAELALANLQRDTPRQGIADNLNQILAASHHAFELMNDLFLFSRGAAPTAEQVDLAGLCRKTVDLLRARLPAHVRLSFHAAGQALPVMARAIQIRQVVMNLVLNGAEAIGLAQGEVRVEVGSEECDRALLRGAHFGADLKPGPYAFLDVSDTGRGMDEHTLRRIFEPFYSTKANGRGLGMAGVAAIVRKHAGAIRMVSEPDGGTGVRIFLPPA